ncbi:MAG: DUF1496 domain-containing protein [Pseudomonadota bacterium]
MTLMHRRALALACLLAMPVAATAEEVPTCLYAGQFYSAGALISVTLPPLECRDGRWSAAVTQSCIYEDKHYSAGAIRRMTEDRVLTCKTAKDQPDLRWRN